MNVMASGRTSRSQMLMIPGPRTSHAGVRFGADVSRALCLTFASPLTVPNALGAANRGSGFPTAGPWVATPAFGSVLRLTTAIAITAATPTTHVYGRCTRRTSRGGSRASSSARRSAARGRSGSLSRSRGPRSAKRSSGTSRAARRRGRAASDERQPRPRSPRGAHPAAAWSRLRTAPGERQPRARQLPPAAPWSRLRTPPGERQPRARQLQPAAAWSGRDAGERLDRLWLQGAPVGAPEMARLEVAQPQRAAALGPDERGRKDDRDADERDGQVDDRDRAEVAQHPDVGRHQRGEARRRRDARGEHGRAGRAVGELERALRPGAGVALLAVARRQQHAELG